MTGELGWDHAVEGIGEAGLEVERTATPEEREALAGTLELLACNRLEARYSVRPRGAGRYRLSGALQAEVIQACVVTLEPVANSVAETFDVEFWPEAEMPAPSGGELDLVDEFAPEPIAGGKIAAGRIVFESLAAALDPFPKKPGATLDWQATPATDASASQSPFSVLARIKEKK